MLLAKVFHLVHPQFVVRTPPVNENQRQLAAPIADDLVTDLCAVRALQCCHMAWSPVSRSIRVWRRISRQHQRRANDFPERAVRIGPQCGTGCETCRAASTVGLPGGFFGAVRLVRQASCKFAESLGVDEKSLRD